MIMDTLAAISLATEPPNPADEKERQNKNDRIILPVMWRNIISQVAYQLVVLITMLYSIPYWFEGKAYNYVNTSWYGEIDSDKKIFHYTMIFNTFILMNLFNQIASRKIGWNEINIFASFFNNFTFLIVLGGEFAAQYFIVQLGGPIFRTVSLTWY